MKIFVLSVFVLTYILIIALPKFKTLISLFTALVTSVVLLIASKTSFSSLFFAIDFNVILMLLGIMITVYFFSKSNMPNFLADKLIRKMPNSITAVVLLAVLAGFVSAFLDNVATLLILAPIGLSISKKLDISPIPIIISMAVSSNLQGAATLVGDTTSIMLASKNYADMSFFDFFFLDGRFSIFWAVELGALLTIPILIFIFRKNNKKLSLEGENIKVSSLFPTVMLLLNFLLLVVTSFIPNKPDLTNGFVCIFVGIVTLIWYVIKNKKISFAVIKESIDFESVLFLIFLFVIIGNVETVGLIDDIGSFFSSFGTENIFLLYTVITFLSVFFSAFIDNIPYVATMLPVIASISIKMGLQSNLTNMLYFGLLCGATLGGNLTPFGASANVVGIGILKKEGYDVKTIDFLKIGLPFTAVAVLGGYLLIFLTWGL